MRNRTALAGESMERPGSEAERLAALARYDVLDTPPEAGFDDVTRLAAQLCGTPIALITLLDASRQWFKSRVGLDIDETPRAVAFCDHTIRGDTLFEVADARLDARFRDNPLVTGAQDMRFYAGVPLTTPDGHNLGTLCVIDHVPRRLDPLQRAALETLSRQVVIQLELRRAATATSRAECFVRGTLDALQDTIAIVDHRGTIVRVNRAWAEFARANGDHEGLAALGEGANYLVVCDRAAAKGVAEAAIVGAALRRALAGEPAEEPGIEYPCHAPHRQRWFLARISSFREVGQVFAVVSHQNITARKLAEQEVHALNQTLEARVQTRTAELAATSASLRASEEKFRSMFENASVGFATASPTGQLQQVNTAFCDITGRDAAALVGKDLRELVHPGDLAGMWAQRQQMLDGAIPGFVRELRCLRPDGQIVWLHASVAAIRDGSGRAVQTITHLQDVTPHKRAEYERDRFFELSVDMLAIAQVDQRLRRVNPAWTRVLGYTEPELLGMSYLDLVHPDDLAYARDRLARLAEGKAIPEPYVDLRMRARSGEQRVIRWSAALWADEHLMICVGRDVTRLRAAEDALRQRDEMLARAEQMAGMGSWHWNAGHDSITCSTGLLGIAGQPSNGVGGGLQQLLQMLAAADRDKARAGIERVISSGQPAEMVCRLQRPDGSERLVKAFVEPQRAASGQIHGASGACLDVTEFKRAEERALASEGQLRALAARLQSIREQERTRISREIHDELGQMLTALKMDLTLFGRDLAHAEPMPQRALMTTEVDAMAQLVDATIQSVRRIARQLRPEVLDALGLVAAIEWLASDLEARTGLHCSVSAPQTLPEVDGERKTALFRIAQEALTNVVRHAGASRCAVRLTQQAGELVLAVEDDGKGFDPTRASGPSLGMLGMRERAAAVGASFEVASAAGAGTTLTVRMTLGPKRPGDAE